MPSITLCHVAGRLSQGADCANNMTGTTSEMDLAAFQKWLEPAPATPTTPEKGAATCMSSNDWERFNEALELVCRMLGKTCKKEVAAAFKADVQFTEQH